jgi:hypothetical protein
MAFINSRHIATAVLCGCIWLGCASAVLADDASALTDGAFGQTYRLTSGFDYTVVSAAYVVSRVNAVDTHIPTVNEKFVVLHVRIKNPASSPMHFDPSAHSWSAISAAGVKHDGGTDYGRDTTGKGLEADVRSSPATPWTTCIRASPSRRPAPSPR